MAPAARNIQEFLDNLTHEQLLDRLGLALTGGGLGIWDWDLRDNSVQFDVRWCEMLGLDHAQTPMNLQTWSERVHPEDMASCLADIQAHLEGRTDRYENIHRLRHADGEWRYILDRGRISGRDPEGKAIRFTGTHFDVTTTERARRVLARQEQILHQLVENLPTGVAMLDRERRIVARSPSWLTDLGVKTGEVIGRTIWDVVPDPGGRWALAFEQAIEGHPSEGEEILDTPGNNRVIRWRVHPWLQADGSPGGILHMTEDITETVLQRRAAEMDREARLAALSVFAGGVAHELNSPLQIILTELELWEDHLTEPAPDLEALRGGLGSLVSTTRRAAAISRALRTLSRDEQQDPPVAMPIANLFRDVEALCLSRVESSGNTLRFTNESEGARALCHPASLLHALLELIAESNAHSPSGGQIRISACLRGASLVIEVAYPGAPPFDGEATPEWSTLLLTQPRLRIVDSLLQRDSCRLRWFATQDCATFRIEVPYQPNA